VPEDHLEWWVIGDLMACQASEAYLEDRVQMELKDPREPLENLCALIVELLGR